MQFDAKADALKDRINNLPLLDENVLEIISLLDDAGSDFEKIVGKLSPEVTAKFLSMANSAIYGVKVRSIIHALRVLGFQAMRQSLVTSLLMDHFEKCSGFGRFRLDKYNAQAHLCAAVSRVLGEILQYDKSADLVTASLLHNIGKLIIVVYFRDEHEQIVFLKKTEQIPTHQAECRILGRTHAEISAMVLRKFNIPEDLCLAIRYHDSEDAALPAVLDRPLLLILREAVRIADLLELSDTLNASRLIEEMQETIAEGRQKCIELQRQEIKDRGYEEFFSQLLSSAVRIVERDLKWIFKERSSADGVAIN
jgi:HD-like signal output (HDOD) protein